MHVCPLPLWSRSRYQYHQGLPPRPDQQCGVIRCGGDSAVEKQGAARVARVLRDHYETREGAGNQLAPAPALTFLVEGLASSLVRCPFE